MENTKHLRDQAELALRIAAGITDETIREQLKRVAAEQIAEAERQERSDAPDEPSDPPHATSASPDRNAEKDKGGR